MAIRFVAVGCKIRQNGPLCLRRPLHSGGSCAFVGAVPGGE